MAEFQQQKSMLHVLCTFCCHVICIYKAQLHTWGQKQIFIYVKMEEQLRRAPFTVRHAN